MLNLNKMKPDAKARGRTGSRARSRLISGDMTPSVGKSPTTRKNGSSKRKKGDKELLDFQSLATLTVGETMNNDEDPEELAILEARRIQHNSKLLTPRITNEFSIPMAEIKANICTSKECLVDGIRGAPHRHQIDTCKQHPYCLADPQIMQKPIENEVPGPLPCSTNAQFLQGVQERKIGETGHQTQGTKTIATVYSLDHFRAQAWNIDIDKMPGTLTDKQKFLQDYIKRGLPRQTIKPSTKPTLQKKLNQWQRAQEEMKKMDLELAYLRNNQDPKIYAILENYMNEHPEKVKRSSQENKNEGRKSRDRKSDKICPKDYVPLVYGETMKVDPLINVLSKEHDEILKLHQSNPGQKLVQTATQYYETKQLAKEKEERLQRMKCQKPAESENYLPSKSVKKRMDSEHLNSWLKRGEIQEVAERYIQFQDMLVKLQKEDPSFDPRALTKQLQAQEGFKFNRTVPTEKNRLKKAAQQRHHQRSNQLRDTVHNSLQQSSVRQRQQKVVSQTRQNAGNQMLIQSPTTNSMQGQMINIQEGGPNSDFKAGQSKQEYASQRQGRPLSTSASTYAPKQRFRQSSPSQRSALNVSRRARLFSAKPTGITSYAVDASQGNFNSSHGRLVSMPMSINHETEVDHPEMNIQCMSDQQLDQTVAIGSVQLHEASGYVTGHRSPIALETQPDVASFQAPIQSQKNIEVVGRNESGLDYRGSTRFRKQAQSFAVLVKPDRYQVPSSDQKSPSRISHNDDHMINQNRLILNPASQLSSGGNSRYASTTGFMKINQESVFNDLAGDDNLDNGHLSKAFSQLRQQKEKDQLLESMNFHMTKYRAQVHLTDHQANKQTELTSYKRLGQSLLQQRLSKQYGLSDTPKVELPNECKTFLGEVQALIDDKEKQDNLMRAERNNMSNPCTRAALTQKAFETLNRSTQQSEVEGSTSGVKAVGISVKTATVTPNESEMGNRDQSSMWKAVSFAKTSGEKTNAKPFGVPSDPRPDVNALSCTRMDRVKHAFLNKMAYHAKQPRPAWQIKDDDFATEKDEPEVGSPTQMQRTQTIGSQNTHSVHQKSRSIRKSQRRISTQSISKRTREHQSTKSFLQFSKSSLDPSSPGIGAPAQGSILKRVTNAILADLDTELREEPSTLPHNLQLQMPIQEWDPMEMNKHIADMESVPFWQQKGLQCAKQGKVDAAMDYYRQGLRKNPNNHVLIYSLATCYCQLKMYRSALQWFSHGINLHPRWIDGLCGLAFCNFNLQDFDQALRYITLAKENSKGCLLTKAKLGYEVISLIEATCLKMTHKHEQAMKSYDMLQELFKRNRSKDMINLVWGLILIPLSWDRKRQEDHYYSLKNYLEHQSEIPLPKMDNQNLLLSRYCVDAQKNTDYKSGKLICRDYTQPPKKLNMVHYEKSILTLLQNKSFFCRFKKLRSNENQKVYRTAIDHADVGLYRKGQPIFLMDRIGIVVMGSIEVRIHDSQNLLKPYVVKKAVEGDILGFAEGDRNASSGPLSWLIAMQDQTEVIYIQRENWHDLWNLQLKFTEQQIVMLKLEQNKYFNKLNMVTKYHLIYECLELKVFFPGQLIMSTHPRSVLCHDFHEIYNERQSKFRKEIDNKIARERNNPTSTSLYQNLLTGLNKGNKEDESPHLKNLKDKILGNTIDTLSIVKEPCGSPSVQGSSRRTMSENSGSNRRHKTQVLSEPRSEHSIDSNSTDYGLQHANESVMLHRPASSIELSSSESGSSIEFSNEDSQELLDLVPEQAAEYNNFDVDQLNEDSSLERAEESQSETTSMISFSKTTNVSPSKSQTISRQQSSNSQVRSIKKTQKQHKDRIQRRSYKKGAVTTTEILQISKSKRSDADRRVSVLRHKQENIRANMLNQVKNLKSELRQRKVQKPRERRLSLIQLKKIANQRQSYKFLIQKQINRILGNNTEAKRLHKRQKRQMKAVMIYIQQLADEFRDNQLAQHSKPEMQRLLTNHINDIQDADEKVSKPVVNPADVWQKTSGIGNSLMIDRLTEMIDKFTQDVQGMGNGEDLLFQIIVKALKLTNLECRQDSKGLHLIDSGEVIVLNQDSVINMRLNKLDSFGLCEYLRKPGPEYLGDVRAGIRPVQTFFLSYKSIKDRVSIPEKISLDKIEGMEERMEGVMSYIASRDKIDIDKLRHF